MSDGGRTSQIEPRRCGGGAATGVDVVGLVSVGRGMVVVVDVVVVDVVVVDVVVVDVVVVVVVVGASVVVVTGTEVELLVDVVAWIVVGVTAAGTDLVHPAKARTSSTARHLTIRIVAGGIPSCAGTRHAQLEPPPVRAPRRKRQRPTSAPSATAQAAAPDVGARRGPD